MLGNRKQNKGCKLLISIYSITNKSLNRDNDMNVNDLTWNDSFIPKFVSECVAKMNQVYKDIYSICRPVDYYENDFVKVDDVLEPTLDMRSRMNSDSCFESALRNMLVTKTWINFYQAFGCSLEKMVNQSYPVTTNSDNMIDLQKVFVGFRNPVVVIWGVPANVLKREISSFKQLTLIGQVSFLEVPIVACQPSEHFLYIFEKDEGPGIGVGTAGHGENVRIKPMNDCNESLSYTIMPFECKNMSEYFVIKNYTFFRPLETKVRKIIVTDFLTSKV